jgi:hypothetical protein
MDEKVSEAVFGNVGTLLTFRVGADDAERLEKEFAPEFTMNDIVNLGFRQIYLKLMMDGVTSRAFSAMTMDTMSPLSVSFAQDVIDNSRKMYAGVRKDVEGAISEWRKPAEGAIQDERRLPDKRQQRYDKPRSFDRPQKYDKPRSYNEPQSYDKQKYDKPQKSKGVEDRREVSREVSLDALKKEPQSLSEKRKKKQTKQNNTKKDVDRGGLRELLKNVIDDDAKGGSGS